MIEADSKINFPDKKLKEKQRAAVLALLRARPVLGILTTGFGKSLKESN